MLNKQTVYLIEIDKDKKKICIDKCCMCLLLTTLTAFIVFIKIFIDIQNN